MADWDADSPRLRQNLINVLRDVRKRAVRRDQPTVEDARRWHRGVMTGLRVPDGKYRGRFRGERGLETPRVWIGAHEGVGPAGVARALGAFERTLQRAVAALDVRYPQGQELDVDGLAAVIDLSAWAHAEWVRMHPFATPRGQSVRAAALETTGGQDAGAGR